MPAPRAGETPAHRRRPQDGGRVSQRALARRAAVTLPAQRARALALRPYSPIDPGTSLFSPARACGPSNACGDAVGRARAGAPCCPRAAAGSPPLRRPVKGGGCQLPPTIGPCDAWNGPSAAPTLRTPERGAAGRRAGLAPACWTALGRVRAAKRAVRLRAVFQGGGSADWGPLRGWPRATQPRRSGVCFPRASPTPTSTAGSSEKRRRTPVGVKSGARGAGRRLALAARRVATVANAAAARGAGSGRTCLGTCRPVVTPRAAFSGLDFR